MKNIRTLIIITLLTLAYCGCSRRVETLPGIEIPLAEMNQDIELIPDPGGGIIPRNKEMYGFQIKNLSDQVIIFPGDYGVKLFIENEASWIEVENTLNYSETDVVLPLPDQFPPGRIVTIIPYIPNLTQEIVLRVVVIGNFENKPDQSVGAYADIILNP